MGAWTKRDINKLRTQMSGQGRSLEEIAEEIRHRTGCSLLAAFRMACGWSQPEAVDRYLDQAPGSVMDQPLLSRLEGFPSAGSRAPQATQIITFAAVYGTTPLRLLDPHALDRLDERERAVLVRCNTAFTAASTAIPANATTGSVRDTLTTTKPRTTPRPGNVTAATDLEGQVEMAARRALRFAVTVEGSNIGPETLEQLREEVGRLAVAYPQRPLPLLLGDLVELQDVAFRLLEGRQRPNDTSDLYLLAGALCGMLAKASHDLSQPHAAMAQARAGYVCADNAGHDGLRAWIRGLQSMIAYWAGWPNEALRYAQLGVDPASRTHGTTSVWLPAQQARVWAILGDTERAEIGIQQATDSRDTASGDELDALGGIMTFSRPRQLYYAADTRVWLHGCEAQAERSAAEAIAAYEAAEPEQRSFSDEAGARADQALVRAVRGDADGAAQALRTVLELPGDQRIGGILASVMRVHHALRDSRYRGSSTARHTQLQIEAYCQVPAAAALPAGR